MTPCLLFRHLFYMCSWPPGNETEHPWCSLAPIVILNLWEVKRSLDATTGILPFIQHRPFQLIPIDMEPEYCVLGVNSYPVV